VAYPEAVQVAGDRGGVVEGEPGVQLDPVGRGPVYLRWWGYGPGMPDDSSPRSSRVPGRSDDSSSSGSAAGEFSRDMQYITTRITADGADGYRAEPRRYRLIVARAAAA